MFDVVIVGGGVVGCATALSCAQAGMRTVLLERGAIAGETSSTGMGHLMLQPEPLPLAQLTLASLRLWKHLHRELGTFALNECGMLWLAETRDELAVRDRIGRGLSALGVANESLAVDELVHLEPALARDIEGGLHCALDAVVVPMQATAALAAAARAHGADVRHGTPVVGIERDGGGCIVGVRTPVRVIPASAVVIAAGVWTPEVAALAGCEGVSIVPRRGDLAITAPGTCPIRMQLLEVRYLAAALAGDAGVSDPGTQALNVQPQARGTCLIGATRQLTGFDRRVDKELLARSLTRAVRFVPGLADVPLVRTWAGLRPMTKDRLPLVGPVLDQPGLWLASGHEGLGLTLAPITGDIVARSLRGAALAAHEKLLAPERLIGRALRP